MTQVRGMESLSASRGVSAVFLNSVSYHLLDDYLVLSLHYLFCTDLAGKGYSSHMAGLGFEPGTAKAAMEVFKASVQD